MVSVEYTELQVFTGKNKHLADLLISLLADIGFESFTDDQRGFQAFIPSNLLDETLIRSILQEHANGVEYNLMKIAPENWNAVWESGFEPVDVNEHCVIRAPFHDPFNDGRLELIIEPRMSFGTGHHATTRLICRALYKHSVKNKTVLDMGCGTGVLGILALKLGAKSAEGIDIESWATENAIENGVTNSVDFSAQTGDASLLGKTKFEVILANINRNVLVQDVEIYAHSMEIGGLIFLSGFLSIDCPKIIEAYTKQGFQLIDSSDESDWNCLVFKLLK